MRNILLLSISFIFFQMQSYSQENLLQVSGTVMDDTAGIPIPGANVIEKGTTNGVMTDFNGEFSLEVAPDAVLEISYLGFSTQEINVDGQEYWEIRMQ